MSPPIRSLLRGSGSLILGVFGGVAASVFMHARYAVPERRPVTWVEFEIHPDDPVTDRLIDAVDYDTTGFNEVIGSFADSQKLHIVCDWARLKTCNLYPDASISLHLRTMTVRQVLDRILAATPAPNSAGWVVHDGIITISDPMSLDQSGVITDQLYDISSIVTKSQQFTLRFPTSTPPRWVDRGYIHTTIPGGDPLAPEDWRVSALIDTIEATSSGTWADNGGNGSVHYAGNGKLLIRQTQTVHARIQRLLELLRQD